VFIAVSTLVFSHPAAFIRNLSFSSPLSILQPFHPPQRSTSTYISALLKEVPISFPPSASDV
jgi:hypothetical protein